MTVKEKPSPGKLISLRGREWVVLPTDDEEILKVKPLGGSDDEATGIYLPLMVPEDLWREASFPRPGISDLGDFETAKLLFEASRLSFRNASGPFRAMGKLSFRPRSYQIVPLVMALKQEVVRLLIADDVGIGKTVEALIILRELIERGEIKRFAVICQPHLCEQWQKELKDKLDLDAEIIRSSTVSALERKLVNSDSIFKAFPYQVISIDYLKNDRRKPIFLNDSPEFLIIDEAHTATRPAGASAPSQQQRYHLLHDLAKDPKRHMVLLTATPHSGKDEEFQSLLGLLRPDFEKLSMDNLEQKHKEQIAKHFIQRKREQIRKWLGEDTPFPDRDTREIAYSLSLDYKYFFNEAQNFARGLTKGAEEHKGMKGKYWAALALLRGIMSSPAAGLEMLQGRINRSTEEDGVAYEENPVIERLEEDTDSTQMELLEQAGLAQSEVEILKSLASDLEKLSGIKQDLKVAEALIRVKELIKGGFNPIIFCKYIATAKYVAEVLREELPKSIEIQAITSELPDEQRKERIDAMGQSEKRILVATDCLSEGINLQKQFNSVLHYDLPWNPNRLEQREGRVDRFGQNSPEVKTWLLWGEDNPIDAIVLKVLIRKVRDIQKSTGVSISLGEDNRSIMDAVLNEVLLDPQKALKVSMQTTIDFGPDYHQAIITRELEAAKEKAKNLRSIFAHMAIPQDEIEVNLKSVDEAIGDIKSVETLVLNGITHLGGSVQSDEKGYKIFLQNLPAHLRETLGTKTDYKVSFHSPTPEGYRYIGRNHKFTEQLCQFLLALAFEQKGDHRKVARSSVIQSDRVQVQTTVIQFRVRNVIKEVQSKVENISEEMYLWGFEGSSSQGNTLTYEHCKSLLFEAESIQNLSLERQQDVFQNQVKLFDEKLDQFKQVAEDRAVKLVEAHGRFKTLVGGKRYEAVHPILPPDILGVYVFLPQPKKITLD